MSLALALDHPQSVRGLVLISTLSQLGACAARPVQGARHPCGRAALAYCVDRDGALGKLAHRTTLKILFAPEPVPSDFDAESGGALGLRPWSFIAASKDLITVADELAVMTPRYPSLAIPVEVISADKIPSWIIERTASGSSPPYRTPPCT